MTIAAGTRLGCYEVLSSIGAGGMGEVYRGRDTKLGRDVALKVLPTAFARDAERMARFEREAKVLALLNHPNITSIYGLEDSGSTHALVMELVAGPTLAERIRSGPLPIDEALRIARQIAEALEYAHEHGIVHRDLKLANVKVTGDDVVKVLDFGLAKAIEGDASSMDMANSPTISRMATQAGVILGTAAYMSPEQAKGKPVDRRADIWAFGCVLYEMLTGKTAFSGETVTDTLAAVLTKEPDWSQLPAATPVRVRVLLECCLRKDPKQRLRDIGDARISLDETLSGAPEPLPAGASQAAAPRWRRGLPWAIAGLLAIVVAALGADAYFHGAPRRDVQPVRLSVEIGADASLFTGAGPAAILSPDGARLALLAAGSDHIRRIYIRSLDQLRATPLAGTEGAIYPFFSPDGRWIGFFADGKLKKISVQGGAAVTLCDAPAGRGGSWGEDGMIAFLPMIAGALSEVSAAGGTPHPLTTLDRQAGEVTQHWPQLLPGDEAVLFTSDTHTSSYEDADIVVDSITSGERRTLVHGGFYGRYLPSGQVVYVHRGTLFAVPFDLKRLRVTGPPAPVVEGIFTSSGSGGAQFSFSDTGTFVYLTGDGDGQSRLTSIDWLDREGKFTPLRETLGDYGSLSFSPDGKRLALTIYNGDNSDIWVYDRGRDTLTRLTFGDGASSPVWTPDDQRIVYSFREKNGVHDLWWTRADGSAKPQRLTGSKNVQAAGSWRPDGKVLAFAQVESSAAPEIMTLPLEGNENSGWKPGKPKLFVEGGAMPAFSPNGNWLAYMSRESGAWEVYVQPFPGPDGKWQISNDRGVFPQWSSNGKELFYRGAGGKIMVVAYTASGGSFHADRPQLWSPGDFAQSGNIFYHFFALDPDGKRFAVLKAPGTEQVTAIDKVNIIFISLTWFAKPSHPADPRSLLKNAPKQHARRKMMCTAPGLVPTSWMLDGS